MWFRNRNYKYIFLEVEFDYIWLNKVFGFNWVKWWDGWLGKRINELIIDGLKVLYMLFLFRLERKVVYLFEVCKLFYIYVYYFL